MFEGKAMNGYTYRFIPTQFAQAYGEGAYNSCTYNCANGQASSSRELVNTGVAVAGVVTLACLIALVAVLVRVWRRPNRSALQEEQEEDGTDNIPNGDPSGRRDI